MPQNKENEKFHAIFFNGEKKRARHLAQNELKTHKIAHHKFTDHHEKTPVAASPISVAK